MRLVRRGEARATPWKNGGGVTYELAAFPEGAGFDDFLWRLSMAEVASDGPFSAFPGVDRTLTLLDGAGIALDFSGRAATLAPGAAPFSFPGEAAVIGRLLGGPILDLNMMTRRGRVSHHVRVLRDGEAARAGTIALVSRRDGARLGGETLNRADAALGDLAGAQGEAGLIAVELDAPDLASAAQG